MPAINEGTAGGIVDDRFQHGECRRQGPDWFVEAVTAYKSSHHVDVAGRRIHYLLWSPEQPTVHSRSIVLVHGGGVKTLFLTCCCWCYLFWIYSSNMVMEGAHAHWWDWTAPFLNDFGRGKDFITAIDLAGHGESEHIDEYSMALHVQEVMAVAVALQQTSSIPPFLIGHSFGGWIVMRCAKMHGVDLAGVIAVDSAIMPKELTELLPPPPKSSMQKKRGDPAGCESERLAMEVSNSGLWMWLPPEPSLV